MRLPRFARNDVNFELIRGSLSEWHWQEKYMRTTLMAVLGLLVFSTSQAITFKSGDLVLRGSRGITVLDTVTGAEEPFANFIPGSNDGTAPSSIIAEPDGNILLHNSFRPVFRLNPTTSEQRTIFTRQSLVQVKGIAEDTGGRVYGFDATSVMELDLQTNQPRIIASGPAFSDIRTIVVDSSGDIIVGDAGKKAILRVNPVSGQVTPISTNGFILKPAQIVIDKNGMLVVVDTDAFTIGYFYRIDPLTGVQTQVLPLQLSAPPGSVTVLSQPNSIAIDRNGDFVVTDNQGIFHINLQTEVITEFAADVIQKATGVAIDPDGNYLFAGNESASHALDTRLRVEGLYRVNPSTGATELLQGLPFLFNASVGPVAVDRAADFVVTSKVTLSDIPAIITLNHKTGKPKLIASGGFLQDPVALNIDADGSILVGNNDSLSGSGSVIRIDPTTGSQTVIASGGNITGIADMARGKNNTVIVLTPVSPPAPTPQTLVEVKLSSGNQRVILSNPSLISSNAIDVDSTGNIVTQMQQIDTITGQTTLLSSGGAGGFAADIVDTQDGSLFLAEEISGTSSAAGVRVNKTTGSRTIISALLEAFLPVRMVLAPDLVNGGRGNDLVIDFGSIGLWARLNDTSWQKLNNSSPDQVVVGDVDGNGVDDVIADFSSTFGGIFIKRNLGAWTKLHNFSPELMAVGDLDGNGKDDVVIDFGSIGLWARMNDSAWLKLNNSSPDQVVVADMDGNGQDDVIADFNSTFGGIFIKRNQGGWSKLHNFTPEAMAMGDLDNNGKDDIVIDFGAIGLWARMNDSAWLKLNNSSPALIATGDLDGNGADDVLATFPATVGGVWQKLNLGGWSQLNPNAPDELVTGDVDGNGQDDVIGKFGSSLGGIFVKRNQGSWQKLHNTSPDSLAVGNLDNN